MTNFAIGDAIKISDAVMPEGSTPAISDRDFTLATIAAPRVIVEDEPEEGAEEGAEGEAAEGEAKEGDAPEGDAKEEAKE